MQQPQASADQWRRFPGWYSTGCAVVLLLCCWVCQGMLLRRLADVASGLCYLHAANVCHGDLKCENTLLRTGAWAGLGAGRVGCG